jgi:hypothetical protein
MARVMCRADPDDSRTFHYRRTKVITHPHRQRVEGDAVSRNRFGQLARARERQPLFIEGLADGGQAHEATESQPW